MKFLGHKMYKDTDGRWFIQIDKESGTYQDFKSWIRSSPETLILAIIYVSSLLSIIKLVIRLLLS